jgi:hypothetical protein
MASSSGTARKSWNAVMHQSWRNAWRPKTTTSSMPGMRLDRAVTFDITYSVPSGYWSAWPSLYESVPVANRIMRATSASFTSSSS